MKFFGAVAIDILLIRKKPALQERNTYYYFQVLRQHEPAVESHEDGETDTLEWSCVVLTMPNQLLPFTSFIDIMPLFIA